MLKFHDPARFGRREFLRIGGLALGGLSLADLGQAAATSYRPLSDRSVVFLFLHGGPSQIETFDPHMEASSEIRSVTGEISTAIPGVTFGSSFPKLAKLANRVSIVRSFVTGDGNHDIKPIVGKESFGANLGSAFAHVAGAIHPETGMPRNLALFPRSVDPATQAGNLSFGNFAATGPFGTAYAPFMPGVGGSAPDDMRLRLSIDRFDDRRALLWELDRAQIALDESQRDGLEGVREKAMGVLLRGVGDAFDLTREDARTVERYDTSGLVRADNISKKWNNHKNYADNARSLGKLLLLARRLCERGAGFVTVTTNFVWDMHADQNNATCAEGMSYMGPPLDHALSVFLEDLEVRGLSERILLVCCGEMGRTPKINKSGGRDHWGNLAPLLIAGGGLPMGQVIGRSARNGGEPNSDPVRLGHLVSTIMHTLFDVGRLRVTRGVPRAVLSMAEHKPIPGLHG